MVGRFELETIQTCFNPRPYVRGDQLMNGRRFDPSVFQSAPLREGRYGEVDNRWSVLAVSIRAPT